MWFLNRGTTPDDDAGPTIVRSPTGPVDGNATAVQQPVGTHNGNVTPVGPPVFFTTDVGPGAIVPGGHYIRIDGITRQDIDDGLKTLYEKVSPFRSIMWGVFFCR